LRLQWTIDGAHHNCLLLDTLPDGSGLTIQLDSTGRVVSLLQAWAPTPAITDHAARMATVRAAIERRLDSASTCGRAEPAWGQLYYWHTREWRAQLGTTRNVVTDGPASIQFQARFMMPNEAVTCRR
jgi:hypothetical protein